MFGSWNKSVRANPFRLRQGLDAAHNAAFDGTRRVGPRRAGANDAPTPRTRARVLRLRRAAVRRRYPSVLRGEIRLTGESLQFADMLSFPVTVN